MEMDIASYQRALGDELRRIRRQRGWTRKDLQERMPSEVSLQTLATYELGTRQCTVIRLVELCIALEHHPHEVLARVHDRVFGNDRSGKVKIDLGKVAKDDQPELRPFRRWARDRLGEVGATQEIALDLPALEQLAALCGLDTVELVSKLRPFTNRPTEQSGFTPR
ncbi:helix-turn-helix domain-containing protein [Sciscionella marina]|uniref:helix-turn-helix domain-containing protein n=1 Tax=Sciscionella marina TaxID=508770 RepID=UPI0003A6B16B|nr:helix-turn-helix domain-containing protein [Sciscionella marina]